MKVWFKLDCTIEGSVQNKFLWIQGSIPEIIPVESKLYLPTPESWGDVFLFVELERYVFIGETIICEVNFYEVLDSVEGSEIISNLLSIGYSLNTPTEVVLSLNFLKTKPMNKN